MAKTVDGILKQFTKTISELEKHGAQMIGMAQYHDNQVEAHKEASLAATAEASRAAEVQSKLKDLVSL